MRSTNCSGSPFILRQEGLKINFSMPRAVHTKSHGLGNFEVFNLWPIELLIIFLIIPMPGWPRRSCQILKTSRFWKITLYATCCTGLMYVSYNPDDSEGMFSSGRLLYPSCLVVNRYPSLLSLFVSTWKPLRWISL
jgi:hypothetical protein